MTVDRFAGPLTTGVVLRVREDACEVSGAGRVREARYADGFPSPRVERVSPGNLVALAAATDSAEVVVWRWYDAVALGTEDWWVAGPAGDTDVDVELDEVERLYTENDLWAVNGLVAPGTR